MNNYDNAKVIGYINIPPPSWKKVFNWLKNGAVKDLDVLLPAIEIADIVMTAQQSNKKSVTFVFTEDGKAILDILYNERT